jgi:hypothetical protein
MYTGITFRVLVLSPAPLNLKDIQPGCFRDFSTLVTLAHFSH